jgi:DNA-binding NarL/FixJ family response regulator
MQFVGSSDGSGDVYSVVIAATPDVALVDYRLGDVSGDKLTRELKARMPRVKVLGISADFDEDGARGKMLAAGADAFLSKYATRPATLDMVRQLVAPAD